MCDGWVLDLQNDSCITGVHLGAPAIFHRLFELLIWGLELKLDEGEVRAAGQMVKVEVMSQKIN